MLKNLNKFIAGIVIHAEYQGNTNFRMIDYK